MKMIRLTKIAQIEPLIPYLTFPDPDQRMEGFLSEVASMLVATPDSILILADFDNQSNLTAFIIATNPGPTFPYIFLPQVWSHSNNDPDWYEPFFTRLIIWAASLDKSHIRGMTQRNTDSVYRRFGFTPYMQVIKLDIHQYNDVLLKHSKEFLSWATSLIQI